MSVVIGLQGICLVAGMSAAENSSCAWNSGEKESFQTMEDSGIDSDQKQQHVQEDGRLFTVRALFVVISIQ
jgi:hypothetical protein